MKRAHVVTIFSLAALLGSLHGIASAHETHMHGKMTADAQMQKLHAMMPMFSIASAKLESAVKSGDLVAVETESERIIAAIPDLKKSRPHKNIKQRKKFIELATNLEKTVKTTAYLARTGDRSGAMSAFIKIEETCTTCHATFRD